MRDLTEDELREYFDFATSDTIKSPDGFTPDQHELIGAQVVRCKYFERVAVKLLAGMAEGRSVDEAMLSLWVSAFQMGRECESRILTRALKRPQWNHK